MRKLLCNRGSVYIYGVCVIMALAMVLSALFEYFRVSGTIERVDRAYEKAMLSVAITNYDEIYNTMREETQIGGGFEGGNETIKDSDEKPEWSYFNDMGDVASELASLLDIDEDENSIFSYDSYGYLQYIVSDFQMNIKQTPAYKSENKYEISGQFHIELPLYFFGQEISRLKMDIPSTAAWKSKI